MRYNKNKRENKVLDFPGPLKLSRYDLFQPDHSISFMQFIHVFWIVQYNSATVCDFQQYGILTSVDSDEPV